MNQKIHNIALLVCASVAILLAVCFFSRYEPIAVSVPWITKQMLAEQQSEIQEAQQKRQEEETARRKADMEARMYQCSVDDDCIIVDKDPCGCLKGPSGVTTINAAFSLEFSNLLTRQFASATTCPSKASTVEECSATARPVCRNKRCQIVY